MYHQTHTKNQHSPSSDVELSELLELSGQMRIELMVGLSEYSASLLPTLAMLFSKCQYNLNHQPLFLYY